jgi:mRNA interferase MazF
VSEAEIWLVDFGEPAPAEPAGVRPALVVSVDGFNSTTPYWVVLPATTTPRALPFEVEVEPTPGNGLEAVTILRPDLLRTVAQRRGVHRLGVLDAADHERVRHIIGLVLGM